jgi:orotidine-5'-phosphate decarboxylase
MPIDDIYEFNRAIIDATQDLVCCYKPNLAFYEAFGPPGLDALRRTVEHIPSHIPVIGDAKRGDIGNTARAYAAALFDYYGFDAVTANPYMGGDTLDPFLAYMDRCVFVVCRTSNPGSSDFQSLPVTLEDGDQRPLYMEVAARCNRWNASGNVGLVVGATYPDELCEVRAACPSLPILLPGIGAQGGDLRSSVANGLDSRGAGLIITSSRQVLYASQSEDFPQRARDAAQDLRDRINGCRSEMARL